MLVNKPIVIVRWNDAQSSATHVFKEGEDMNYHKPMVMETLGWLLKDDEQGVSVMNEAFSEEGLNYRGHTFVPRSLIISIETVKAQRKRRPRGEHHESLRPTE